MRSRARALRGSLVPEEDIVVFPDREPGDLRGVRGLSWCVTPWAQRVLRGHGATVSHWVSPAVVKRVNHRAWAAGLGLHLAGARFVTTRDELSTVLNGDWPSGGWLFKRALSYAGRGRLHLRCLSEFGRQGHEGWMRRSLLQGGLLVEPYVTRLVDLAMHGWIGEKAIENGAFTRQVCDDTGAWVSSERWEVETWWKGDFERVFRETADALRREGYRGAFGVDGYVWRDDDGKEKVQPRSEVNARYSMGWAVGMGDRRPDLDGQ